jgi:hypothetical protein
MPEDIRAGKTYSSADGRRHALVVQIDQYVRWGKPDEFVIHYKVVEDGTTGQVSLDEFRNRFPGTDTEQGGGSEPSPPP